VKTFDSTPGPVKWTFTPGHYSTATAASLVPPTVGLDGIYSVGTDGVVYAMQRGTGPTSGLWPPTWNPVALGKPAHNRSPVVTFSAGARLFVGTENGEVHAVDARTGSIVWSRAAGFPAGSQQLMPGSTGTQATPAGLFKSFGGLNDLLLVGTATSGGNTQFFALDPVTGATRDYFPTGGDTFPGPIDNVYGMAVVDYASNKVYFGTAGSAFTLWGLDMGPSGAPDLKLLPAPAWNPQPLGITGGTTGAPVARNGRLYLGTDNGAASAIHSLRVSDGNLYSYTHGDGQVKGFVWPDRRDDRLYFSTVNNVHGVRDDGMAITPLWSPISVQSPSIPLQRPGTDNLYVGDGNGRLLQIDVVSKTITPVQLDTGTVQIGAPSLDNVNSLVLVGSDKGVIYAVRVP
jgi:outer membrane protein assembly factor BamB